MKTAKLMTILNTALLMGCVREPAPVETTAACTQAPHFEQGALIAKDCAILPGNYWPAKSPAGGFVLLHNFGDYHKAFNQLGPELRAAGYSAIAFDQRGFGDAGERGRWYGQEALVNDAADAAAVLRKDIGDKPIYILGESMGGSVALLLASKPENIDGLVLAAPGVREGIDYRWFWDAALWAGDKLVPTLDVSNPRGDGEKLSQAAQKRLSESEKVVTDVRIDTYAGLVELTDAASAAAYDVKVPTLLLYGGEDETIDPVAIKKAEDALGRVTTKRYPKAPHLLFQSIYKDEILQDTLRWVSAQ